MQSFADLGVSDAVVRALSSRGIDQPFPVQSLVIQDVHEGRDVLVKSPTGSGKTLAFGVPLVERAERDRRKPTALVLVPTRELASQIAKEIEEISRARRLQVTAVYGGVGLVNQGTRAARSQILIATPGRLEDQLQRRAFSLDSIDTLVLDEADRMLDMGFRPAIERIVGACPADRQTLFFSATLDGVAGELAKRYTRDALQHTNSRPATESAGEIEHRFVPVVADERLDALLSELDRDDDGRRLVFVRTKHGADRLVKRLAGRDVNAVAIHGNKSQRQREQAIDRFQSGRISTLVATDVAARGIDIGGVSLVVNFDPPGDEDTYVHRIGRTGRAGNKGIGVTLVAAADRKEMSRVARVLRLEREFEAVGGVPSEKRPRHASGPSRDRRRKRTRASARAAA